MFILYESFYVARATAVVRWVPDKGPADNCYGFQERSYGKVETPRKERYVKRESKDTALHVQWACSFAFFFLVWKWSSIMDESS